VILAQSFWRKTIVTVVAATAFVSLYEVTILDSKNAGRRVEDPGTPAPGQRLAFDATAYCKGITTTSGVAVQSGIAAADPSILPVGSIVQIEAPNPTYDGIYTVLDTGPSVQGHLVDLYIWSCNEALRFGRKSVRLTVLRLGWNPQATTPTFLDRLLKRHAPEPALPSRPLPQAGPSASSS
jgi:3D (Asp-Asp-Asp) domain-containing protein